MTTMLQGGDFAAVPELGYEEWRAVVRSTVGRYNPVGDPNAFAGRDSAIRPSARRRVDRVRRRRELITLLRGQAR